MEITLSIIGSAGRKDDAQKMSKQHFQAGCLVAEGLINQLAESNYPITHLVSGGAAFIDHIAVKLFLDKKVPHLRIFMPCEYVGGSYHDTGVRNPHENPGGTANYYHKKFQTATNINSLTQLQIAKAEGAELINGKNFYARNALVAKSDFILACTFGNGAEVKEGGTADTIRKYLDRVRKEGIFDKSFHYDLNSGEIHVGCVAPKKGEDPKTIKQLAKRLGIPPHPIVHASFYPPPP